MKTTLLKIAAVVALVAGIASTSHAAAPNPFNVRPSEVLINNVGGPLQSVQSVPRPRNGEWYQGSIPGSGVRLAGCFVHYNWFQHRNEVICY